jgi:pimeloyl-ACP methyl ester carboxylesterase
MDPHSYAATVLHPSAVSLRRSVLGPETAPPVLVLHGITGSRRYWLPRILPLASRYRLYLPDLPGFGFSPKPFVDYTPEFFVDSLMRFLDEEQGPPDIPVHIVGHSLGAVLALEIAARHPGRVGRLVLLNLPRFNHPDEAHQVWIAGSASYRNLLTINSVGATIAQVRRTGLRLTARYVRRLPWGVVADARRFTFRSLTSTLEHCLLHYRVDEVLAAAPPIPSLFIHGDADQVAPVDRVLDLPMRRTGTALHVIRGAGHHPFHTHTSTCLRLIDAHLAARPVVSTSDGRAPFGAPVPGELTEEPSGG